MTAPTINGPVSIDRLKARAERVKLALKSNPPADKKARLEAELESIKAKASELSNAL